MIRFGGIGICAKCGDTQGPWTWSEGRWLCDSCISRAKEYEKINNQSEGTVKSAGALSDSQEDESSME